MLSPPHRSKAASALLLLVASMPFWASAQTAPPAGAGPSTTAADANALRAPFITVNSQAVSRGVAELAARERLARSGPNEPVTVADLRETLAAEALMAGEAVRAGLEKDPQIDAQLEWLRLRLLAQAWQRQTLAGFQPTEDQLKVEWERLETEQGTREVRVRHLLVAEEPTAKLLLDMVRGGRPMASLAEEYSRDEASRRNGGLTEWANEGLLIPGLAEAVKPLRSGQMAATPVRSRLGWHVVQLDEARERKPTTVDTVRPLLVQRLAQRRIEERLRALRQSAKVD
jgi:peptidyl-prolyl cis-trans isomerase C